MRIRFGDFVLDHETRQVTRGADALSVSPKALQLLELLVEARPRVVRKEEIIDRLWPDVTVEEANVRNLIAELRGALGDNDAEPRYIRTAHRQGYAFIAPTDKARRTSIARLYDDTRLYALRDGENIIGKDAQCDVRIAASGVSGRHARIDVLAETTTITDLRSKNGTWLNGRRIEKQEELRDGDQVRVGVAMLTFRSSVDQSTTTVS